LVKQKKKYKNAIFFGNFLVYEKQKL
jgi:hypothetical protein